MEIHAATAAGRRNPLLSASLPHQPFPRSAPGDGRTPKREDDPLKVFIAQRLPCETTMTLAWIAERLRMGSKTNPAHFLVRKGLE
jgi:hypothetical protein